MASLNNNNGRNNIGPVSELKHTTKPVKRHVKLSERKFDINSLPADMRRVYDHLEKQFGEEYGLLVIFSMRTSIELHRAWHMSLLSSNILQQIKEEFGLRMTWELGVIRIKFRVEDGSYELHFRVPYDYDSEYQDIYYRIVLALIEGQINIHEALLYQSEAKNGMHTAKSGLFLRDFPGRLILYPLQAGTCAVIFFSGHWLDGGVAAVCGVAAGLIEYMLGLVGGRAKVLLDVIVGLSTGLIGGLWYRHGGENICLSSVFLGTLYWFFYGTAFVIGLLEIVAGNLETGVTRFIAVSVKTFVLSLGASLGLMLAVHGGASEVWDLSEQHCDENYVKNKWWRIPLYLLCSVAVLGQYRLPISQYWQGLVVQLIAYELQFTIFNAIGEYFTLDQLDTAASNLGGAAGGVLAACILSYVINKCRTFYSARLLQKEDNPTCIGTAVYKFMRYSVKAYACIGVGRETDIMKHELETQLKDQLKELNDPAHPRERVSLEMEKEDLFLETIVSNQDINIWAILMPAVYQLVPGSIIAKMWFQSMFPSSPFRIVASTVLNSENKFFPEVVDCETIDGARVCTPSTVDTTLQVLDVPQESADSVFSNLMVISTSLALGLIFGFAIVQSYTTCLGKLSGHFVDESEEKIALRKRRQDMMEGMYTQATSPDDDPESVLANEPKKDELARQGGLVEST